MLIFAVTWKLGGAVCNGNGVFCMILFKMFHVTCSVGRFIVRVAVLGSVFPFSVQRPARR